MEIELIGKNVPSKKNSKIITKNKRIISSQLTRNYEEWVRPRLQAQYGKWQEMIKDKEFPLKVGFYFYRDSKRKYDFINIVQTLADELQECLYIPDDDVFHFIPIFLGSEVVKKDESGVKFIVLD